jgi:hypothetical protein
MLLVLLDLMNLIVFKKKMLIMKWFFLICLLLSILLRTPFFKTVDLYFSFKRNTFRIFRTLGCWNITKTNYLVTVGENFTFRLRRTYRNIIQFVLEKILFVEGQGEGDV